MMIDDSTERFSLPWLEAMWPTGATEPFSAPGAQWWSDHCGRNGLPVDQAAHEAAVHRALVWLRGSPIAWFEIVANTFGAMLYAGPNGIAVITPGDGPPPRAVIAMIGYFDPQHQAPQPAVTLQ